MPTIRNAVGGTTTIATTVVTTAETIAITSPLIQLPSPFVNVFIWAWCQLTLGTGITGVTPRVRRGNTITSPLVGLANLEAPLGAAGTTVPRILLVVDQPAASDELVYSFTVQQAGATANGTVLQATILVFGLA